MLRQWKFKHLLLASLIFIGCQNIALGDVASLDSNYTPGMTDVTTKLNNDRIALTNSVNNIRGTVAGSVQTSGQIKADTISEENMADDANSRIRTAEGAACSDFVASGLLPTTSSSLVLTIPVGVAYPDGYRIEKTSATAVNLTATKWTYFYILTSGSFATNEVTIDSATPTAPANSAVLFRATTSATAITAIMDLRKTSCAAGPFEAIADSSGEATLEDLYINGTMVRTTSPVGTAPQGFAQGLNVVYADGGTSFTVKAGSAYINGFYRSISTDTVVPITADAPSTGVSGIDTGAVAANTQYYVYAVADQTTVKTPSFSFSTSSTAPSGLTNYRLIGGLKTESNTRFVSRDVNTVHALGEQEIISSSWRFDGTAAVISSNDTMNISGITDNGTGNYTVAFDVDYQTATTPKVICASRFDSGTSNREVATVSTVTAGSAIVLVYNDGAGLADSDYVTCEVTGDTIR